MLPCAAVVRLFLGANKESSGVFAKHILANGGEKKVLLKKHHTPPSPHLNRQDY